MPKLMELKNVSKTFPGVQALKNVNIDLNAGEVLGLCGENGAGKSTLMKILTGIYKPDPGAEVYVGGERVEVRNVNHARDLGLSIIHQELNMVNDLTVAQNLFLGRRGSAKAGVINDADLVSKSRELFEQFGMRIDPRERMGNLSVARQQMVEIARALSYDSRILVMDEPTAALTEDETEALFKLIRGFISPTTGVIYISHRMPEISEITDRVSVLRDGEFVGTVETAETDVSQIVQMMVGRALSSNSRPEADHSTDEVALQVKHLSTRKLLKDVSFEVHKGEIVGFAGLVGAGRTEVARCVFGADPATRGEVFVRGKKVTPSNTRDAVNSGICYLSEDRKRFGVLLDQDISSNVGLASMDRFSKATVVNDRSIADVARTLVDRLKVRTPGVRQLVGNLSGGNQQKVVISKWLLRESEVMFFDEPTRGIDVGAKAEIYRLLEQLAAEGKAIVVISSELPEILRVANRIIVMADGRITGSLANSEATQEKIMELATVGKHSVVEGAAQ